MRLLSAPLHCLDVVEEPNTEQRFQRPPHCLVDRRTGCQRLLHCICQAIEQDEAAHLDIGAVVHSPVRSQVEQRRSAQLAYSGR